MHEIGKVNEVKPLEPISQPSGYGTARMILINYL